MDEVDRNLCIRGEMYTATREEVWVAREKAKTAAIEAVAAGKSQHHVARLLGVDRMTIRKWLGEQ